MDQPLNRSLLDGLEPGGIGTLLGRLLAIADDAVVVADDHHRIVLFNEGAERIFGHAADQMLGQPLDGLLPEAARARHAQHLQEFGRSQLASRRMAGRREIHGRRADGTLFVAEASISHVALEGRTFFTAIVRDVTEQRLAQRALAASEARFRVLAATAPVGIFQTDAGGGFAYVNDRWCEIAGLSADEALGTGWLRALHPGDRQRVRDAWRQVVAGGAAFDMSYRFVRADGTETWVMGNAVASHDPDGGVSGHIGTIIDVTASQRQAQALERAKSEAEAAARAKSLFLANMSHEIRTPLNAVIGMTTLLLDTPMSEDQRDFARTIRTSGESLLEIINDILDYSKADVGKLEIEQRGFDLRDLVEQSLDQVTPRALEKNLNLAYLIEEGTPEALIGDPARVRQILVNLLSNAVKFTPQGEVFVAVDGARVDDETHCIRFAIKDTGIGIAADQLPRLFQSFMQVDASTTRKYGGTGLGLAISRRLAELMGGQVTVESEPGQGSTFTLELRMRRASVAPAEYLQRNAPALAGKRILIVDDNLTNRRILTKMALLWGMLPSTFPSGLEALDRVRHGEAFDIALLDMSMPEFDGMDLAGEIRRQRGPEALPIVLLTSLGQRQVLQAGAGLQLAACLSKPIKAGVLFNTLVAVVGGATLGPSVPAPVATATRGTQRLPLRVLVAEDNRINQRVTLRLLQHLGYQADLAADGREVLEAVQREPYDVVLMDIQMPELDGVSAAREIARRRGPGGLPRIVAMTANAMPGDRETYIEAGMDGYLAKPIELVDLASALAQVAQLVRDRRPGALAEAVDPARLEHLKGLQNESQPSLVRDLIDMFCLDAPVHSQRLRDAVQADRADLLRSHAHRFLSATQNIGAQRLSSLCIEIEGLARAGRIDAAGQRLAALDEECRHALAALGLLRLRY